MMQFILLEAGSAISNSARALEWFSISWMENYKARQELLAWSQEGENNREVGRMCLVDEMHVIEYVYGLAMDRL